MSLSEKTIKKTFWRSFPLQGAFNYERQQSVGWVYGMVPGLSEIYADDPEGLKEALYRHTSFYNTTPQMTNFIQGVCLAMEEKKHADPSMDGDTIVAVRTALIGPLAGIGDSIFWGTLRTIGLGIGVQLASQGNYLGPIIFCLIYNIPNILVRKYGFKLGYEKGAELLSDSNGSGLINEITNGAKLVGCMVVGAMIASMVSFSTTLTLHLGDVTFDIQSIFDGFMPKLLPLAITFLCYRSMKKGTSTTKIMLLLILLGIIITALEGLPIFGAVAD